MTDLADFIEKITVMARERVQTVGAAEYGGAIQLFETKHVGELQRDILEEVADIVAYAGMIALKTLAIEKACRTFRGCTCEPCGAA